MKDRTNQEWLDDLRGPDRDEAVADLRAFLVRGLGYSLANHSDVDDELIEDFAQDALLRILDNLDTFRGESRFTTWAQKIAVRVAFTELRRHRWRDLSLEAMAEPYGIDFVPDSLIDPEASPDQQAIQRHFLESLQRLIDTELTEKHRQALVAVRIQGIPLEEAARRMGTNRNALYKLLHDARQRLKSRMEGEGLSPDPELLKSMTRQILTTRPDEIGCGECFEQLDRFVDMVLAGKDAAVALPLVQDHLNRCDDCREEYEALLAALQAVS